MPLSLNFLKHIPAASSPGHPAGQPYPTSLGLQTGHPLEVVGAQVYSTNTFTTGYCNLCKRKPSNDPGLSVFSAVSPPTTDPLHNLSLKVWILDRRWNASLEPQGRSKGAPVSWNPFRAASATYLARHAAPHGQSLQIRHARPTRRPAVGARRRAFAPRRAPHVPRWEEASNSARPRSSDLPRPMHISPAGVLVYLA